MCRGAGRKQATSRATRLWHSNALQTVRHVFQPQTVPHASSVIQFRTVDATVHQGNTDGRTTYAIDLVTIVATLAHLLVHPRAQVVTQQ